ncbi:MAG TPA: hypothetical protein VI958_00920 [Acidobacteriota bacterium]
MNLLKKLFSGSAPRPTSSLYTFFVKCNRCGETIEGHVNLSNDLSVEYDGDREVYFVRKGLLGSGRCFQQIEVELKFDTNKNLVEKQISGGQFVE